MVTSVNVGRPQRASRPLVGHKITLNYCCTTQIKDPLSFAIYSSYSYPGIEWHRGFFLIISEHFHVYIIDYGFFYFFTGRNHKNCPAQNGSWVRLLFPYSHPCRMAPSDIRYLYCLFLGVALPRVIIHPGLVPGGPIVSPFPPWSEPAPHGAGF